MSIVAYGLRGEGLVWLIGAVVCLLDAPPIQLFAGAGNGWPHNALRYHWFMSISCLFQDCKALLVTSVTHVRSAITNTHLYLYLYNEYDAKSFP